MKKVVFSIGKNKVIMAGRYNDKPKGMQGVKLAEEIRKECAIDIPIVDYSTPSKEIKFTEKVINIILLSQKVDIYMGCMGGIGRTGLVLSILKKVEIALKKHRIAVMVCKYVPAIGKLIAPIYIDNYRLGVLATISIRNIYNPHAVETKAQEKFVNDFDVLPVIVKLQELGII